MVEEKYQQLQKIRKFCREVCHIKVYRTNLAKFAKIILCIPKTACFSTYDSVGLSEAYVQQQNTSSNVYTSRNKVLHLYMQIQIGTPKYNTC